MPENDELSLVVAETLAVIREIRQFEKIFEDQKLPRQDLAARSVRYENQRVIRMGLAEHPIFRGTAARIGAELAKYHSIQALASDAGLVPKGASVEELAGLRFLTRLVDAVIAGRKGFPRNVKDRVSEHVKLFDQQISSGEVEVEWVYPILGTRIVGRGVSLAPGVTLRPMRPRDLKELYEYEVGFITGPAAPTLLLFAGSLLSIRRVVRAPGGYATMHHNEATLRLLAIATAMIGVRPFKIVTWWARPVGPSVFAVRSAQWQLGSYGLLGSDRTMERSEIRKLKRTFSAVQACPEAVLASLAVESLVSSTYRSGAIDRLVDTWVGLEAMLLTKDENTELQYRMSLRAARLLREEAPREFIKEVRKAYGDRSKVLHGTSSDMGDAELTRLRWSQEQLRRLVALAVTQGKLPDLIAVEDGMVRAKGSATLW